MILNCLIIILMGLNHHGGWPCANGPGDQLNSSKSTSLSLSDVVLLLTLEPFVVAVNKLLVNKLYPVWTLH